MAAPEFVVLEVDVAACAAEVFLNDIAIARCDETTGRSYRGPVNQYVVPGENRLSVVVAPREGPADVLGGDRARRALPADAEVRAALAGYPRGAVSGGPDRSELVALRWTPPPGPLPLPQVLVASCGLGAGFGAWGWQSAPPAALEQGTREEVLALVSHLHNSLENGAPKALFEASAPRVADVARAYGADLTQKRLELRMMVMQAVSRPGWGMQPLDPDAVVLRPSAGGRLVEVLGADGKPALRDLPDPEGAVCFFPLLLAKLDGEWAVVR